MKKYVKASVNNANLNEYMDSKKLQDAMIAIGKFLDSAICPSTDEEIKAYNLYEYEDTLRAMESAWRDAYHLLS